MDNEKFITPEDMKGYENKTYSDNLFDFKKLLDVAEVASKKEEEERVAREVLAGAVERVREKRIKLLREKEILKQKCEREKDRMEEAKETNIEMANYDPEDAKRWRNYEKNLPNFVECLIEEEEEAAQLRYRETSRRGEGTSKVEKGVRNQEEIAICPDCQKNLQVSDHLMRDEKEEEKEEEKENAETINLGRRRPQRHQGSRKVDESSERMPDLPERFKELIRRMNGSNEILLLQKNLFQTDVKRGENRLSIPKKQVRREFLTEEEEQLLSRLDVIEVILLQPSLQESRIMLKKWQMKPDCFLYVLTTQWNEVVKNNSLKAGTPIQVWSFRVGSQLGFALVNLEREVANGPSSSGVQEEEERGEANNNPRSRFNSEGCSGTKEEEDDGGATKTEERGRGKEEGGESKAQGKRKIKSRREQKMLEAKLEEGKG